MPRLITAHKVQASDGRVYQAPNTYESQATPAQPDAMPEGHHSGKTN